MSAAGFLRSITSSRRSEERNQWTPSFFRSSHLSAPFLFSSTGCQSSGRHLRARHYSVPLRVSTFQQCSFMQLRINTCDFWNEDLLALLNASGSLKTVLMT